MQIDAVLILLDDTGCAKYSNERSISKGSDATTSSAIESVGEEWIPLCNKGLCCSHVLATHLANICNHSDPPLHWAHSWNQTEWNTSVLALSIVSLKPDPNAVAHWKPWGRALVCRCRLDSLRYHKFQNWLLLCFYIEYIERYMFCLMEIVFPFLGTYCSIVYSFVRPFTVSFLAVFHSILHSTKSTNPFQYNIDLMITCSRLFCVKPHVPTVRCPLCLPVCGSTNYYICNSYWVSSWCPMLRDRGKRGTELKASCEAERVKLGAVGKKKLS